MWCHIIKSCTNIAKGNKFLSDLLTKGTLRQEGKKKISQYCIFIETDPNVAQNKWVNEAKYIPWCLGLLRLCFVYCTINLLSSQYWLGRWLKWQYLPEAVSAAAHKTKIQSGSSLILHLFSFFFFSRLFLSFFKLHDIEILHLFLNFCYADFYISCYISRGKIFNYRSAGPKSARSKVPSEIFSPHKQTDKMTTLDRILHF